MPQLIFLTFICNRRTRADQRHLAAQHIDELWQLVQAGPPEKTPDLRYAWVVGHLVDRFAAIFVLAVVIAVDYAFHELRMDLGVVVHIHRAEFQKSKFFPELAKPLLLEEHRP